MSSFYFPFDFDKGDIIKITDEEFKHIKVQRKTDKQINISNGNGLFATAIPTQLNKDSIELKILNIFQNYNENIYNSTLFFGLIDDKSRIEFIIEKATELGVNSIYPLICEYTQYPKFDLVRSEKKAISALKQSERSFLPKIYNPIKFTELNNLIRNFDLSLIADIDGINEIINSQKNIALFVGPEGGFSNNEKEFLFKHCKKIKLSNSVLRTETACISLFQKIKL